MSEESPLVWHRRKGWRRARMSFVGILFLLVIVIVAVWLFRKPLADDAIEKELEKRGVQASYELDRVGLRTQRLRNIVIGDPDNPDLVADFVEVKTRISITGSVNPYRITARGVRLKGRWGEDGLQFGELDKLIPEGDGGPFELPNVAVDLADTQVGLATPYGPVGLAIAGKGHLKGGFKGMVALSSSQLAQGDCRADEVKARLSLAIDAGRPNIDGPIRADSLACGDAFALASPILTPDLEIGVDFDAVSGAVLLEAASGRFGDGNRSGPLVARLAADGPFDNLRGDMSARLDRAEFAGVTAGALRLEGDYRLDTEEMDYRVEGQLRLADGSIAGDTAQNLADGMAGLVGTPLEPVARKLARAIVVNARDFAGEADFIADDEVGLQVRSATVAADAGGRLTMAGGRGVVIPLGEGDRIVDTAVQVEGGGLPDIRLTLEDDGSGLIAGRGEIAPYRAGGALASFDDLSFRQRADGWLLFDTDATITGPIPDGFVESLRLPVDGRIGPNGQLELLSGCRNATFRRFGLGSLTLENSTIEVCSEGNALFSRARGLNFSTGALDLGGSLGGNPFRLTADSGGVIQEEGFTLTNASVTMGDPDSPVVINAEEIKGAVAGGLAGTFFNADATIGSVVVGIREATGFWQAEGSDLYIQGELTAYDRNDEVRFYPLISENVRFQMVDGMIDATGTLQHPYSGIKIMDVAVTHNLDTGYGDALLDLTDGVAFDENLQPEELTPITEGVIALVVGQINGTGEIGWGGEKTVSTGTFNIVDTDLAASFGPVTGLNGTINFSDLLNLETPPNQLFTVDILNPGVPVGEGVVTYQLLGEQLVKIERGIWPFMGGDLILRETIMDFGRPSAKRLTFEVLAFDAELFVQRLEFDDTVYITGIFDGVFPMIFDEDGGRIVGGRLDAREGGGIIEYKAGTEDLGLGAKLAMSIIRSLRYGAMIVRLDGELDGEFATTLDIDQVRLGETTAARILRQVSDVPVNLDVEINGPFRALIATLQSFDDPQTLIADILPGPLEDIPGAAIEVIRKEDERETEADDMPTEEEVK
ncbi:intermembrane phospholipid transport protein YdbH family protein [Sphingomicrobium clamense]|uniref:YdbH domain-containing protein n=1 Tax=Sphingomicrobium clamense TaxID=2851013 RepID=A0ABS6V574_9SPHN|nr:YdbH domain-containing protein [Sphingomicrobium sp. B8]MBW0144702.1 YdbH domain-containing protein [Sphingomicrobium sp. B8]